MTSSPLQKFVFTPVILSASVFAILTIPLIVFGSKPVTIQLQEEPMFHGQVRDIAAPYLGVVGLVSLGAGIASVAVAGWRQSAHQSAQVKEQLSGLTQNLKHKEELLEAIKLSESNLEASGLNAFLDAEVTQKQPEKISEDSSNAVPVVEPLVITTHPIESQAMAPNQVTVQAAAAKFASSQSFLAYAQTKTIIKPPTTVSSLPPSQVEQLQHQLEQIKTQMESLQATLQGTPPTVESEAEMIEQMQVRDLSSSVPLRVLQSWSIQDRVS